MCHFQEITVVAGDGKSVKIHLGGEKELEDCRRQVTFPLATCHFHYFITFAKCLFHAFLLQIIVICLLFEVFMATNFLTIEDQPTQVAEAAGLKHVALPEFENADGRC